tara:strand:- start:640 stop:1416 length:777 start_codon:yes stop_codon:yes gene_type:complete
MSITVFFGVYSFQEKLLFKPTALAANYTFYFTDEFEEVAIPVDQENSLNGLLFKSEAKKGVVLYFHGNKGSLPELGKQSKLYTKNGYDILYVNYRGFGKSSGCINSEDQLLKDAQITYDFLKKRYEESQIIVSGISVGSGVAAYLAANNSPNSLLLIAPYTSFKNLVKEKLPFVPSFLWKYELNSNTFLLKVNCPITIFHGKEDKKIPYAHALLLKKNHAKIHLVGLEKYGHTDFLESKIFQKQIIAEIKNNFNKNSK